MDEVRQLIALMHLREIAAAIASGITALVGFATSPEFANRFALAIELDMLARATIYTLVLIGGLFAVISLLEALTGAHRVAYAGRTFRQDVVYALFYQGGFYQVLMWSALANAMENGLSFLKWEFLAGLPAPLHWLLYWISVDFITYWWHRLLHSWGPLWAFHSVHHAQPEMNFISSYRLHPLEQLMQNMVMVAPLLIMGVPTFHWLPLMVVMALLEGVQHSALEWDYGRGYRVLVSPRFHALHHSSDPQHFNRNFSKILSIWDFLFGTAVREDRRPEKLGVEGMAVPRTIGAQLLAPFRLMGRRSPRRESPAVESWR
jgi:sterol desaturase/sphingolipid hydroxylase (fatty acid hydroxylase superfamily)